MTADYKGGEGPTKDEQKEYLHEADGTTSPGRRTELESCGYGREGDWRRRPVHSLDL